MSNVIVKENETLDSALRRFKRSCAKAGIQQEIRKESITRNQAFVVRKNLKPQENVNIINCAQKSLAAFSQGFLNPAISSNLAHCLQGRTDFYIW